MNRAGTLWKPFLLFGGAAAAIYPLATPSDSYVTAMYLLAHAAATAAVIVGVRLYRPTRRLPWYCLASFPALWFTGNALQRGYEFAGSPLPLGSIVDVFFIAGDFAFIGALVLLLWSREGSRDSWLGAGIAVVGLKQSTALALQNERLLQLDRLKDDFVASVSHELRTPLTSIRGYLELVLLEEAGKLLPEQRECLEIAERNGERLLHLVDDLLFVAQGNAGRLEFTFAETDLRTLAVETVESARSMAEDRGITLTSRIGNVEPAMVDRIRIAQLLDNLLSNALKFTPQGGKVRVRVAAGAGVAVLEVGDTGTGISAEDQQGLFERFYRSESAKRRAVPGTGLGLSIAKAIAEAHGGTITVTSAVGEGTLFRVELPLTQAAHSNADALEAAA